MTIIEWLSEDKPMTILIGIGGAAALAATDWRGHWRFAQHVFVGAVASASATPAIYPILAKVLNVLPLDQTAQQSASAFIVGAFSIYLFEFAVQFWKAKTGKSDKE